MQHLLNPLTSKNIDVHSWKDHNKYSLSLHESMLNSLVVEFWEMHSPKFICSTLLLSNHWNQFENSAL